jgi:hypothetical protein
LDITIHDNDEHFLKHESPIEETEVGIIMDLKEEHP